MRVLSRAWSSGHGDGEPLPLASTLNVNFTGETVPHLLADVHGYTLP